MSRFIALVVLVLGLAGGLAWHFRVDIANAALPLLLARQAHLEISELEVADIRWRESRLERIRGRWHDGGRDLSFDLQGVAIAYVPQARRLVSLQIDSARVTGAIGSLDDGDTTTTSTDIPLLPLGIDALDVDVLTAQGALRIAGHLDFTTDDTRFRSELAQPDFRLLVTGPTTADELSVELSSANAHPVLSARIELADHDPQRIAGTVDAAALIELARSSEAFAALVALLSGSELPLDALDPVAAASAEVAFDVKGFAPLRARLDTQIERLTYDDTYELDADVGLDIEQQDTGFRIALAPGGAVNVQSLTARAAGDLRRVRLQPDREFVIDLDAATGSTGTTRLIARAPLPVVVERVGLPAVSATVERARVALDAPQRFEIRLGRLVVPDQGATAAVATTTGTLDEGLVTGRTIVTDIRLDRLPQALAPLQVDIDWRLDEDGVGASGRLHGSGLPTVSWELRADATSGGLEANWREALPRLTPLMTGLIEPLADKLELEQGTVTGALQLRWRGEHRTSRLDVHLNDVGATLWGVGLSELNAHLSSDDVFAGRLTLAARLQQAALGIGADVRDTRIRALGDPDRLQLDELSFVALGGSVRLKPVRLDLAQERHDLLLEIARIDLGRLLRVVDIAGLSGSGRLSGTIPLRVEGRKVAIADGELTSTGPGTFSYDAGDGGSMGDNIALQALRNFQFDTLQLGIDYATDGAYRLKARIVGRNPDLLDSRLIALNPDIQGKLPGLLLAIMLGDFEAVIRDAVLGTGTPSTDGGVLR